MKCANAMVNMMTIMHFSLPIMYISAFYKWIKDKLNAFNDAYILLLNKWSRIDYS